jgi:Domain of Unknown Function (DUF1080)
MKRCHWMLLVLALGAAPLRADDEFKPEEGYTFLFNGKDLTGWRYAGSKENLEGKTETGDKRFEVLNGVIVANEKDAKGKGGIKDLYTLRDFNKDFHIKMEFRASLKSDSGVYIRGPQLQVRDFIRRNEQKQLKKFKNDDWNELDITVKIGVVTTSVNGKALTDKDVLELTVKEGKPEAKLNGNPVPVNSIQVAVTAVATCLCNGEPLAPKTMNVPMKSSQSIGLQAETGKFEFRRIRFKELP